MRQLDLFAGIGGISLAAEWAGIETVAFCEKEPFAQDILRRRFPGRPIYDDIFDLTREVLEHDGVIGERERGIDIVAGGFPCQPFSNAGKRGGTADDRYLWPEMCRIVRELRPSWVFAENVDGLVSMAQSDWELVVEDEATICEEAEMVLETIRQDLEAIGYRALPIVVPAAAVGASHRRYRILIVAYSEHVERCERRENDVQRRWEGEAEQAGLGCSDVADTKSERCGEAWEHSGRSEEWTAGSSPMGYTNSFQLQREQSLRIGTMGGRNPAWQRERPSNGAEQQRAAQSGMGGGAYELPDWLDGWGMNPLDALINFIASYPQPALMGQPQHSWEPPRVATGVKHRTGRLKALGNAVDPLQALPVLYGIRVVHDHLMDGGSLE